MNTGFPFVAGRDARVLILGSMPGIASLTASQYYAHRRNAFWKIMDSLFEIPLTLPYTARLEQLKDRKIALWDVIHRCHRHGSLDTGIISDSIVVNDFETLFARCPAITHVFFNGRKAQQLYLRHVERQTSGLSRNRSLCLLPSTSPAHASLSVDDKIRAWSAVRAALANKKAAAL